MRVNIRIGEIIIECSKDLAALAGFSAPYRDDETRTARDDNDYHRTATKAVAQALSEGLVGEAAVLRAVALRETERRDCAQRSAAAGTAALNAQAAQATLRAEQIASARQKRSQEV